MLLIELLIDLFFLSDIALNFNTGYISEQVVQCTQLHALDIRLDDVGKHLSVYLENTNNVDVSC